MSNISRRDVLHRAGSLIIIGALAPPALKLAAEPEPAKSDEYRATDHWWTMTIDVEKCIGCGNCVRGCAQENGVPNGFFRTWVERYSIQGQRLRTPPRGIT